MPHVRWIALLLLATAFAVPNEARAAKEKFVRSKPHVNVSGPIRLSAETLTVKIGLLLPAVQAGRPAGSCSGMLDLRILSVADPGASPLAENEGVAISPGGTAELSYDSGSTGPVDVYIAVVAREMDGVKTPDCILRGQIETTDNATGVTTRSLPVRGSDFVALKKN
jgi:hypothetical protein